MPQKFLDLNTKPFNPVMLWTEETCFFFLTIHLQKIQLAWYVYILEKSGNEFGLAYPLIQYTFSLEKGRKGDFLGVWKYWEKINFSTALRLQGGYPSEWDDCNTFLWLFLMVVLICFVCHDLSHLLGEVFVALLFPISHKWVNFWEGSSPVYQTAVWHHQQMKG